MCTISQIQQVNPAKANPFFPGRVAHGYLILSFAAVFALFCSACSLLVFAVVKFVRAVRAFRNRPRYVGIVERYEAPHLQENFKRAGQ